MMCYSYLHTIFSDSPRADAWPLRSNSNLVFDGKTPMDFAIAKGASALRSWLAGRVWNGLV